MSSNNNGDNEMNDKIDYPMTIAELSTKTISDDSATKKITAIPTDSNINDDYADHRAKMNKIMSM